MKLSGGSTDILERNLTLLKRQDPRFVEELLRDATPAEDAEIFESRSGKATMRFRGQLLHSKFDPEREAERLATHSRDVNRDRPRDATILYGFGLGYHLEALLAEGEEPVIVVEPSAARFLSALSHRDLTSPLSNTRTSLVIERPPQAVIDLLNLLELRYPAIVAPPAFTALEEAYFEELDKAADSFKKRNEVNANTLARFGKLWVRNLLINLRTLASSPGLGLLEGAFEGIPTILIAAGPTLDTLLPRLPELRRKAILLAVDTALPVLQREGIVPDFAVVVDPQYWNTRHLDSVSYDAAEAIADAPGNRSAAEPAGAQDLDGSGDGIENFEEAGHGAVLGSGGEPPILIAEPSTHPRVFRLLSVDTLFGGSLFPLGKFVEASLPERTKLGAGGSVATSAWDAARLLGSREIYTIGLDLGFPDLKTHARGSFFEERGHTLSSRLTGMEDYSFRYLRGGEPFIAEDSAGAPLLSDRRMQMYSWWFESQWRLHGEITTFTLAKQSLRLEGRKPVAPELLLSEPDRRQDIERGKEELRRACRRLAATAEERFVALLKATEGLREEIESVEEIARRGQEESHRLLDRLEAEGDLTGAELQRLDQIDIDIARSPNRDVLGFLMQEVDRESRKPGSAKDRRGKLRENLERSRGIYRQIRKAGEYHKELFAKLLDTRADTKTVE